MDASTGENPWLQVGDTELICLTDSTPIFPSPVSQMFPTVISG